MCKWEEPTLTNKMPNWERMTSRSWVQAPSHTELSCHKNMVMKKKPVYRPNEISSIVYCITIISQNFAKLSQVAG